MINPAKEIQFYSIYKIYEMSLQEFRKLDTPCSDCLIKTTCIQELDSGIQLRVCDRFRDHISEKDRALFSNVVKVVKIITP